MKSNTIATVGTLLMITLFLASFALTSPDRKRFEYRQDRVAYQPADKPERPPPHRGHQPPPGIPPTVLFLIGGALGYLIGRKSHRFPPPPPPHYFERT